MLANLKSNRVFQFLYGTTGIYLFSFICSIIHEKLFKQPYPSLSHPTESHLFTYPVSLLLFPYFAGWVLGYLFSFVYQGSPVTVPHKNILLCASGVIGGTLSYNIAILYMSYPIVIMMKSCSILSAIIVGVFFSRVRDQKLKLGRNKLIVGAVVTVGILLFNFFAADSQKNNSTASYFGMVMIFVSLVADGMLPDFQAEVKSKYKPRPIDLLWQINRAVFLISLVYSVITLDLFQIINFLLDHPWCFFDQMAFAVLHVFIQVFVYYMVSHFKQHVVPFVITVRKILSVVLSLIWFKHQTRALQIVGLVIVMLAAAYDFWSEKMGKDKKMSEDTRQKSGDQIKAIQLVEQISVQDKHEGSDALPKTQTFQSE